jgi:hypothetical protein
VLPSQQLSCTGDTVTYAATNAIDGDPQTGWGTQEPDGTGQQLVVRFDAPVHLTLVSMTPGYTRVGPTSHNGCQSTSRFFENRIIDRVRYTFDDGRSIEQSFTPDPKSQSMAVNTTTRSVTIDILQTELPVGPNVDDNTVISEVSFRGST